MRRLENKTLQRPKERMNKMLSNIRVPSKESLRTQRFYKVEELDPHIDNWDGWLACDEKGPYTFAKTIHQFDLNVYKGEKIYISEYYDMLEEKIIDYYKEADLEIRRLRHESGFDSMLRVMNLLKLEAAILILKRLHNYPPIGDRFLTNDELEAFLAEEIQFEKYSEYLSIINIHSKNTPLGIGSLLMKTFHQNKTTKFSFPISHYVLKTMALNNELN
jgi:hypothetical protein